MTTIRVSHNKDYTVLSNKTLRDRSISRKAKGFLVELLSYPDDWEVNVKHLVSPTERRDSVISALRELEEKGYLVKERRRNDKGQFVSEYVIYEFPKTHDGKSGVDDEPVRISRNGASGTGEPERVSRNGKSGHILSNKERSINGLSTNSLSSEREEQSALPSTQKTIEASQSEPTPHPVNSPIPGKGNVPARGATHSRTSFGLEDREWACHAAPWRESVATWKDSMLEAVFRSDKKYYSLNKDGAKRDNRHCESLLRRLEQAAQVYHGHPEIEANALHSRRELLRFWEDAQGLAPSAMAIASPADGDWTKHPNFEEWRNECMTRGTTLFQFPGNRHDPIRGAFVDWALENGIFEVSA